MRNKSAQRVAVSGLLTSLMLVLGLIERQFPLTAAIPGIKLGLANSVLLYALYMLGIKQSIVLMLLKALMSWVIYTNMSAMLYSLAGGVLSLLAMILLSRIKGVSIIGVSALGAVFFNMGQILMAVIMLNTPQLMVTYLPILMVSGVVTGVLTGVVAQMVMKHLKGSGLCFPFLTGSVDFRVFPFPYSFTEKKQLTDSVCQNSVSCFLCDERLSPKSRARERMLITLLR